jgi:hypothetical protein
VVCVCANESSVSTNDRDAKAFANSNQPFIYI